MTMELLPIYVTLEELKSYEPCERGWRTLLKEIEYDKDYPLANVIVPIELILDTNGPADANWALQLLSDHVYIEDQRLSNTPVCDHRGGAIDAAQIDGRWKRVLVNGLDYYWEQDQDEMNELEEMAPGYEEEFTKVLREHIRGLARYADL